MADRSATPRPCLYVGHVMHRRFGAVNRRFRYRIFSVFVDLDALDHLPRLMSHNRFNLFGIDDRDHGARDGSPLRPWVERHLARAGIDIGGGRICLLALPRVVGYVFNPLSIFFCYAADGRLAALLYEVKNTFGQQHGYLLPVAADREPGTPIRQGCDKSFYVSPFLPMAAHYRFRVVEPDAGLAIVIRQTVDARDSLVVAWTARRRPLSDATLLLAALAMPFVTLKVIAAIHWQALGLWRRGAPFHRRPAPPRDEVTVA
jgi:uncharacterized protein